MRGIGGGLIITVAILAAFLVANRNLLLGLSIQLGSGQIIKVQTTEGGSKVSDDLERNGWRSGRAPHTIPIFAGGRIPSWLSSVLCSF